MTRRLYVWWREVRVRIAHEAFIKKEKPEHEGGKIS
jgi:chorismate-pyruvate lyase